MSKYRNRKTQIDGITFDSKAESARYVELKLLQKAGVIRNLRLQPRFELQPAFRDATGKKHRKIEYVADFAYEEDGKQVVEDCKGVKTQAFAIKQKLFLYTHRDIEFRITAA